MVGGGGADTFIINNVADIVTESAGANATISSRFSFALPTNVNTLQLTGTVGISGHANSGNDTIIGNSLATACTAGPETTSSSAGRATTRSRRDLETTP